MFIMSKLKGFGQAKTMVRPPTRNTLESDDDEDYSDESASENGKNTCMAAIHAAWSSVFIGFLGVFVLAVEIICRLTILFLCSIHHDFHSLKECKSYKFILFCCWLLKYYPSNTQLYLFSTHPFESTVAEKIRRKWDGKPSSKEESCNTSSIKCQNKF